MLYVIVCGIPLVAFLAALSWIIWELRHAPMLDEHEQMPGAPWWHAGDR